MSLQTLVFNNQSVTKSTTTDASAWFYLDPRLGAHSLNGNFTGTGVLKVTYDLVIPKDADLAKNYTALSNHLMTSGNIHRALTLRGAFWIRFYAQETGGLADIAGLYLHFGQTGKTS